MLVVELKSGNADSEVFGQISTYIGLLSEKFPERNISGVIIVGRIDDNLIQAIKVTDKVSVKTYRMSIELEDV